LDENDVKNLIVFIKGEMEVISSKYLIAYSKIFTTHQHTHATTEVATEELYFLYAAEADLIVMNAIGITDISINNQPVVSGLLQIIIHGTVIRSNRFKTIYFSEIHKHFVQYVSKELYRISVDNVVYKFEDGSTGIQPFSLVVESGTLMGIIGNSGAGKSTLLGILNGTYKPSAGSVLINEEDIHSNKQLLEQIGFIPQDDLLISELTVFENLYYSARLSIGNMTDDQLRVSINKTLNSLGLYEIRNIKVGDALNKFISGGQRKRLNIALELIREPKILLVDEPTSGLSSNDAGNIMDLLREIADRGSIVMVVIH
jgi:ABC-type lipoprotein export system ATPase subunit